MKLKYTFKIDGMVKDTEFNALPFGRQIEHHAAIDAFKALAKTTHIGTKRKSTDRAMREFRELYRPTQWLLIDRDRPGYKDDSKKVWYTTADLPGR